ncbi:MAG: amidophosphoribosyltransferase [Bacteroidota bacterium]
MRYKTTLRVARPRTKDPSCLAPHASCLLDEPREECGVFGVYADEPGLDVAHQAFYGLLGLQHRGQESAGIAVTDGTRILCHKNMGLVRSAFRTEDLKALTGFAAVGHVRYSTSGQSSLANAQPMVARFSRGTIAIAHNGNLANAEHLLTELELEGSVFQSTSDTEVILNLLARFPRDSFREALRKTCAKLIGSYSLVMLTRDALYGVRDPHGNRPLCLGKLDGAYLLASESAAFSSIGGSFLRDVAPGELVVIDRDGLHSEELLPSVRHATCAMEYIYFARPDSVIDGRSVHEVRKELGRELARAYPIEADVVVPVPDSGYSTAIGFAGEAGLPLDIGLIANRYVGRTFIQPHQDLRKQGVTIKLSPIEAVLRGKRVVIIDDSIVRGTTTSILIKLLRGAGAREVHMYVSSPPYANPCYYGIDVPGKRELIASSHTVEEIRRFINADTLHYLTPESLTRAIGRGGDQLCLACFTGDYPIVLPEEGRDKNRLEKKG